MSRTLTGVIPRWALLAVPSTMLGLLAVAFFLVASDKQTTRNMSSENFVELSEKEEITDPSTEETAEASTELSDQFEENIKQAGIRNTAQKNLKEITLALHNYDVSLNRIPIFAIGSQGNPVKDFNDKPLLSWRVALLPYLDEEKLFKEFRLDEPWDSEHNKKLIPRMPKLFQSLTKAGKDGFTHLQMVIGPKAMQPNNNKGISSIVDGMANTVAVVEAAEPVIWTKPADVMLTAQEIPQKDFRAKFGGQFPGGFFVSMWDGSIHFVEDSVSDRTLADIINPSDGKELGSDQIFRLMDIQNLGINPSDGKELGSDWKPKTKKSETVEFGTENAIPILSLRAEPNELYNWAQLSRDGNKVFAGVGDRIRAWDARTGISICNIELMAGGYVTSCNDSGTYAVSLAGNKAVVWELNLSKASAKRLVELKDYPPTNAKISPDGTRVVTFTRGAEKQTARVWDAMTGKPLMELKNKGAVVSAEFHSEGKIIVTTCLYKDGKIGDDRSSDYWKPWSTLWDSKSGNKICDGDGEITTVDRRHNLLLSNSLGNVALARFRDNGVVQEVHKLESDRERITVSRAVINSHANLIVTAGEFLDETARVWHFYSPYQLFTLKHGDTVEFVDISPTGDHLLTAGPTIIRIWSLKSGKATGEPANQRKKMAREPAEEPTKLIREPADRSNGLLGGWKITSVQRNGKNQSEDEGPTAVFFTKNIMYLGKPGLMGSLNYRLDESAKPAHLDIDSVPEKVLAILERDGDTLKICMGKSRPVRFESITGSSATLLTLKRDASAEEPKVDLKAMDARAKIAAKKNLSSNNLKQIGLALLNYESTFQKFPKAAITDKNGQPLLSWRVAILPFIDQEELYKQFKLDEPWDSNHNKKLLAKMPKQFGEMGTETAYRAFTGKGTMFEQGGGVEISSIRDGTNNTALVIETSDVVSWTKPDEVPYDPTKPLPKFGGKPFEGGFHVLFADGSVRFLSSKTLEETIRGIITRNGREFLPDLDR